MEMIKELKSLKKDWIKKISYAIKQYEVPLAKKSLKKTFLDMIVRWYPQIDQDGYDSYSAFKNCKSEKPTLNARLTLLTRGNLKFSKKGAREILHEIQPKISFEHNPPVDYIVRKLIEELPDSQLNSKQKFSVIKKKLDDEKYFIWILSEEEKIPPAFKSKGSADCRLKLIWGREYDTNVTFKVQDKFNEILKITIKKSDNKCKINDEAIENLAKNKELYKNLFTNVKTFQTEARKLYKELIKNKRL
jgi:hypothetical protein